MPFKDFAAGDVLTALDVDNLLMRQTVMTFDDATDRTTQLGTAVAEGMVAYLLDTNSLEYYDSSAWQPVSNPGDITAVTAGTALSGGGSSGDVTLNVDVASVATSLAGTALNADGSTLNVDFTAIEINNTQVASTLTTSTATSYTFQNSDANTYLRFTNTATLTVSTATAFDAGEQVQVLNDAASITILPGTDVTLYGRGTAQGTAGFTATNQYDAFSIISVGTNAYRIIGNVEAV